MNKYDKRSYLIDGAGLKKKLYGSFSNALHNFINQFLYLELPNKSINQVSILSCLIGL